MVYTYLNRPDATGFNPWATYCQGTDTLPDDLSKWAAWGTSEPCPAGWSRSRVSKMHTAMEGRVSRPIGRQTFLQALEAVRMADEQPHSLAKSLIGWRLLVG